VAIAAQSISRFQLLFLSSMRVRRISARFWSAATEFAQSPLSVGAEVATRRLGILSAARAKSGDFADSVTALQDAGALFMRTLNIRQDLPSIAFATPS
jgi:hypothetical protein